jgi:hypothetical protein
VTRRMLDLIGLSRLGWLPVGCGAAGETIHRSNAEARCGVLGA